MCSFLLNFKVVRQADRKVLLHGNQLLEVNKNELVYKNYCKGWSRDQGLMGSVAWLSPPLEKHTFYLEQVTFSIFNPFFHLPHYP